MERDAFHVSYLSDKIPEAVFHGQPVKTVAYLRVSTAQQDLRSQRLAILEYARKHDFRIDDFIEATASGQASEKRRRLDELLNVLQRGDRLVVSELSRLGRSLGQIVAILDAIAKAGVAFVAMKENIRIEGQRDLLSERTREGLAKARASGQKLGRPKGSSEIVIKSHGAPILLVPPRLLLAESVFLALLASALALPLARWGVAVLVALSPTELPRMTGAGIDLRVILVTFAAALAIGVIFGGAAAWPAARTHLAGALKDGAQASTGGGRGRRGLLVAQSALSMVLLVGAGLLVATWFSLSGVDAGFDAEGLVAVRLPFKPAAAVLTFVR